ncbi:calcitonin gene-related peptide type 1 receptor-like isoform X2 [Amphibalanus amphitrite]|uniref:calcitonin gene-related peptide type 1 receptor-like isoform X2 n=1 Tax=Amphibalanus amphitrite TaxID=1232801 RepID=UPI001C9171BB|nr:calcitonin gene-related peptide type 1 receptor-like isoform X2 [Amphibalanus amphitrite]XP_043229060.1 calcitonin gene-related peptide type 1 receptor-like isoform X2 [Amphibalanus amphitrite]XP_043229061.1 calcitonin gene-related peptide type 1 receptor-like isoform X2 [Amphibalanus amphitrite]XP_043229062.1 calcitonin gene-related peptide type 1 receptor-like isoform X2 [Amphibalanus amphitrite]
MDLYNNSVLNIEDPGLREAMNVALKSGHVPIEDQWRIDAITKRYHQCLAQPEMPPGAADEEYCPRVFDGWSCFNYTKAGETQSVTCPYFVIGMNAKHEAYRSCLENGEWFRHPDSPPGVSGWSNYTTCVDLRDLSLRQVVNSVYICGYSISLAAIIISLLIFMYFRTTLNSTRVRIHINLFVSFMINNFMWIMWYEFIVDDVKLLNDNTIWCRMMHIVVQYFMVANYFWMFCEGLYLHTVLAVAFVTEGKLMKWLYVIGWIVPVIFTGIYAVVRGLSPNVPPETTSWCWMEEAYTWLLSAPVCTSMLANFVFLVRIVWILVRKLRAAPGNEEHNNSWRAVRATLILIPLLGLNYMLAPFRPEPGAPGENVYQILNAVTTSAQGFCVALLFCFMNGEVLQQFKKKWQQSRIMKGKPTNSYAFTTMSTVPPEASMVSDPDPGKLRAEEW